MDMDFVLCKVGNTFLYTISNIQIIIHTKFKILGFEKLRMCHSSAHSVYSDTLLILPNTNICINDSALVWPLFSFYGREKPFEQMLFSMI
jgi:hypothetical protein